MARSRHVLIRYLFRKSPFCSTRLRKIIYSLGASNKRQTPSYGEHSVGVECLDFMNFAIKTSKCSEMCPQHYKMRDTSLWRRIRTFNKPWTLLKVFLAPKTLFELLWYSIVLFLQLSSLLTRLRKWFSAFFHLKIKRAEMGKCFDRSQITRATTAQIKSYKLDFKIAAMI